MDLVRRTAKDVKDGADAAGGKDSKEGGAAAAAAPEEPAKPKEYIKDLLVSFGKLPAETLREDLKEACQAVGGKVRYVDYSKSQPSGIVRLDEVRRMPLSSSSRFVATLK